MSKLENILSFLAGHYIESFPKEAVRILEQQQNLPQIKSFIANLNTSQTILIFSFLNSQLAKECLSGLERDRAIKVLCEIAPEKAAAILRHFDRTGRKEWLSQLPKKIGNILHTLMHFPPGSAGAMMNPYFFAVEPTRTLSEIHKTLKIFPNKNIQFLYVIDDTGKLLGKASFMEFLQGEDKTPIQAIMRQPEPVLPAGYSSQEILIHSGWKEIVELPVIDEDHRILGTLSFQVFLKLQKTFGDAALAPMTTMLRLVETGWIGMMATCQYAAKMLPMNSEGTKS